MQASNRLMCLCVPMTIQLSRLVTRLQNPLILPKFIFSNLSVFAVNQ